MKVIVLKAYKSAPESILDSQLITSNSLVEFAFILSYNYA